MKKELTPLKATRQFCLECSGGSPKEVRLCPITECPQYRFRFGTNPSRKAATGGFRKKSRVETLETKQNEA